MATFKGREVAVKKAIESLIHQVDEVILYDNEQNPNLYDNGKFYGLTMQNEPCYYFTCDDDLEYPPNYVERTIEAIEKYKCIITHHGRLLKGLDLSYYRGHTGFRCLDAVSFDGLIDVCGTGVTAFRTDYFNPVGLHNSEDVKMSDLVFSLEAKKQNKDIRIIPHAQGWIKHLPINFSNTIHATESRKELRQIQIANEIWKLK